MLLLHGGHWRLSRQGNQETAIINLSLGTSKLTPSHSTCEHKIQLMIRNQLKVENLD